MKNIALIILATLLAMLLAALSVSCRTVKERVVEQHWDTLLVVHTDTFRVVRIDTVKDEVVRVMHDSVVVRVKERITVNEQGDTLAREKETLREGWHLLHQERDRIQHTVDSLLRTKIDSVKQSVQHEAETEVTQEKKRTNLPLVLSLIAAAILGIAAASVIAWEKIKKFSK